MEVTQLLGITAVILLVVLYLHYYKQRWPVRNFPPGPTGLPLIGTALTTGTELHFHKTAAMLIKSYGNICSLMMGMYWLLFRKVKVIKLRSILEL